MSITPPLAAALIGSVTAIGVLLVKEWWFGIRRQRLLARRLLVHLLKALAANLPRNPRTLEHLSLRVVEPYMDAYLADKEMNAALDAFLEQFVIWKAGGFENATERDLSRARDALNIHLRVLEPTARAGG